MNFLHPGLLAGAALFAVPLIIHLLNRQRFKRRPWAAMEFLLAAYKKQRRRLRQENLLLLLLRCLIPILLALAIARPVLRGDAAIGTETGAVHHVIVLDHSASMSAQLEDGSRPGQRARQLASQLVDRLQGRNEGSRFSLIIQGLRTQIPVQNTVDAQRIKAQIGSMGPTVDTGGDLTQALVEAAELAEEETDAVLVHLFTDMQLRAFGDEFAQLVEGLDGEGGRSTAEQSTAEAMADTAADAIRRINEQGRFLLYDTARASRLTEQVDNLQLTSLRLRDGHALRAVAAQAVVTVRNLGLSGTTARVTLTIDGGRPVRRQVEVEAGGEAEIEFDTTFTEIGTRRLEARLEPDALEFDDVRSLVVTVRDSIQVLAVENVGDDDPQLRESTHTVEILDPAGDDGASDLKWFDIRVVDKLELLTGRVDPSEFDLVILCNVSQLGARDVEDSLIEAVRSGTGLLAMVGEGVDVDSYNRGLYRGGLGPMPMELSQAFGYEPGGEQYYGSRVEDLDHPVFEDFRSFGDDYVRLLENLPVYRLIRAERPEPVEEDEPQDPSTVQLPNPEEREADRATGQVLLAATDGRSSPLWVASTFGSGKAMFLTSPISRVPGKWNLYDAIVGEFVITFPMLWPMARWLTLPVFDDRNVLAGAALSTTIDTRPDDLRVMPPERAGATRRSIPDASVPLPGARFALPPFTDTGLAGFYEYEFSDSEDRERSIVFAVSPDPEEGRLQYFTEGAAKELLGVEKILTRVEIENASDLSSDSDDLGPHLLWLLLALLCGEAAMARFVSRRRS